MYLCEAVLMAIITMLGVYVTYTDIKKGLIQNKALLFAFLGGAITNAAYFVFYCRDFFVTYLMNFTVMTFLAIALYGFHFWAAGDSKLLICVNFLFPARLYDSGTFTFAPGINGVIYIFLIAYLYIVIDSIILFVKKEHFYSSKFRSLSEVKKFALNYLVSFLYLRGFGEVLRNLLGNIYYENQIVFSFINVFLAMLIYNKVIFKKWYMLLIAVAANIFFVKDLYMYPIAIYSYGVLFFALILRSLLNGYNYREIDTDSVEKGMVLSYTTVMYFMPSRIKGLPDKTYEDMRSRLKQDEVDAIKRWKDSKYGKDKITIVRKIPFAIFVIVGEIVFFFMRIWR
jgi:preflagellin peptidase FlaK